jgi:UDP-N-acetylglucosamine 1-carboxyvinyltransferase
VDKLIITGGKALCGEVSIGGAKNAAVGVIPAALLASEGECIIENLPRIDDVLIYENILDGLGSKTEFIDKHTLRVNSENLKTHIAPLDLVKKMRASYYLIGVMLGRFRKAEVALPGGCDFGVRPIDQHIKGFEALGAKVVIEHGIVKAEAERLVGAPIYLDVVSVGATINIMLAAVLAEGITTIENAAKEPHVVDVANFLNSMGANIKGAGTDTIKIKGVEKLHGSNYTIIPDMIEAGTFMVATATTGGDVLIKNVIPKHLETVIAKFVEMNIGVEEGEDSIRVYKKGKITKANIKTLPYPGFPTDLQPQMGVLLTTIDGMSMITEGVWETRFQYIEELKRMGANARVEGRIAMFEKSELSGAPVKATDLRAGVAMVLAGLIADGQTEITNLRHLDRGYEDLEKKFIALGAKIVRIHEED